MKIVRNTPVQREVTPTSEERLASKLSTAMASGVPGLLLSHDLLSLMSARLSESTALSDALACLLATFSNLRCGLPYQDLIDLSTYGKALKSLHRALKDPNAQYATTTLAAVTILYQVEVAYDSSKGPNKALHCATIYDTMLTRGPPPLDDALDMHLAFENLASMLFYTLLTDMPNFYADQTWQWTLQSALDTGLLTSSPAVTSLHTLHLALAIWPSLTSTLRTLHTNLFNPLCLDLAMDLLTAANTLSYSLQAYDETIITSLITSSDVFFSPSQPNQLSFSSATVAQLYTLHAMASLSVTSLISDLTSYLCLPTSLDESSQYQTTDWAARICNSVSYAASQGPEGAFLVPGLVVAYPVLGREVMDGLREMEGWKYSGAGDKKGGKKAEGRSGGWSEKSVVEMGVVLGGRAMFGEGVVIG